MESKIALEKVKDLNLLCNYENGAIVSIEPSNVPAVLDYLTDLKLSPTRRNAGISVGRWFLPLTMICLY